MAADESAVRSLLIPMEEGYLLLPSSVVAEVVSYSHPEPLPGDYPDWLLGRFNWRGQRVPCLSFEAINGSTAMSPATRARVLILKALGDRPDLPYFAMVAQGIPRLVNIDMRAIESLNDDMDDAPAVAMPVLALGEPAFIPDMRYMEDRVYRALYG
ncbi:MAG: chemotaxis protein CheW [Aquisalimonadaceae bacterium]